MWAASAIALIGNAPGRTSLRVRCTTSSFTVKMGNPASEANRLSAAAESPWATSSRTNWEMTGMNPSNSCSHHSCVILCRAIINPSRVGRAVR